MRMEIEEKIRKALEGHHEIIFAYLHGSFLVTEGFMDIDIAVYVDDSVRDYLEYELSLAVELERMIGKDVDVRVLNDAPPAFRYRAIKGKVILDRDPEVRLNFIERTVWEYLDYEPLERRMREEFLSSIKRV